MKNRVGALLLAGLLLSASAQAMTTVQTELMLLCDISSSIDATEYALQRTGYANAFLSPTVQALVAQADGGVAVSMMLWSGEDDHKLVIDWTHLTDATSCNAFATAIGALGRPYSGLTAPGSAIAFGLPSIWSNGFDSRYQIMDVSGDGIQNDGLDTATQRDLALASGVDRINGLAIESPAVQTWYAANIQGGTDSFTMFASGFDTFGEAVEQKILREVAPVPEPSTAVMIGLGLVGAAGVVIRRKKNA